MVDPAIISIGVAAVALTGAAAYSYLTGRSASVDIDSDGDEEVRFEGSVRARGETTVTAPEHVRGRDLSEVKGVGPSRADKLIDAGFETAADLYFATDEELTAVKTLGDHVVSQIREDIGSPDE